MNPSTDKRLIPSARGGVFIILPVLNEIANICRLLDQIEAQLASVPFKVGIVDDGSTDGTLEYLGHRMQRSGNHLHLIRRKKTIRASQRGSALRVLMLRNRISASLFFTFLIGKKGTQRIQLAFPELPVLAQPLHGVPHRFRPQTATGYSALFVPDDEPRRIQDFQMFHHRWKRDTVWRGQFADGSFSIQQTCQHPPPRAVRESREDTVQLGLRILNHLV